MTIRSAAEKKAWKVLPAILLFLFIAGVAACAVYVTHLQKFGLSAEYFDRDRKLLGKGISRRIDFSSRFQMGKLLPVDNFSIRWTGSLRVPKNGRYLFSFERDNGLRFQLDGRMLIDEWTDTLGSPSTGPIELSKGLHKIQIDYFERWDYEMLKFYWRAEGGGSPEIVPAECLLPQ